jgi:hypothetical protein
MEILIIIIPPINLSLFYIFLQFINLTYLTPISSLELPIPDIDLLPCTPLFSINLHSQKSEVNKCHISVLFFALFVKDFYHFCRAEFS